MIAPVPHCPIVTGNIQNEKIGGANFTVNSGI